jgi:hypothetical protein
MTGQKIKIKPFCKKELRQLYGVSKHVFNTWLNSISSDLGEMIGGLYNIRQVELILDRFGIPGRELEI